MSSARKAGIGNTHSKGLTQFVPRSKCNIQWGLLHEKTPRFDLRCFFVHRRRTQSCYLALRLTAFAWIKSLQNDFFPCCVGKSFVFFQNILHAGTAGTMELFRVCVQYILVFCRLCWHGCWIFSGCFGRLHRRSGRWCFGGLHRRNWRRRFSGLRCRSWRGRFRRLLSWLWSGCFRWRWEGVWYFAFSIYNFKTDCSANGSFTIGARPRSNDCNILNRPDSLYLKTPFLIGFSHRRHVIVSCDEECHSNFKPIRSCRSFCVNQPTGYCLTVINSGRKPIFGFRRIRHYRMGK